MRLLMKMAAAGLSLILLAGCTTPEGPPIMFSQETDQLFANYLGQISVGNDGAFAVSPDGVYGFFSYCVNGGDGRCDFNKLNLTALSGCKKRAGVDCIVIAHNLSVFRQHIVRGGMASQTSLTMPASAQRTS